MIRNRGDIEPIKGMRVRWGAQVIIPTYVRESEAPTANGACLTHDYTDREIDPAGWYVEYHSVNSGENNRSFIPFGALSEVPDYEDDDEPDVEPYDDPRYIDHRAEKRI